MRKIFFILFIAHYSLQIAEAQQPIEEWVRIYNSPDNMGDHFIDMVLDNNGNIYQTGWNLTQSQNNNIITVKYNSSGVQQWGVSYNGKSNASDIARGMAVDSNGNCYVAGYSGINFGPYDGILIKYNSFGDTLWTRKLATNLDDEFTSIAVDINNFVYVTGRSGDSAVVFKYDSTGNVLWRTKHYESSYRSQPGIIKMDRFSNFYVGGNKSHISSPSLDDILIRKYADNGVLFWAYTYNSPYNNSDRIGNITIDITGNCYTVGSTYSPATNSDISIFKLNTQGLLLWQKFYNSASNNEDGGISIVCDSLGSNIYITGSTFISGSSTDYITIKYNSIGDTQWVRTYNGPGNYQDNVMDITIDKQQNVYITGESSTNGFNFDVATIKYSSSGNQQWVTRWNSPGNGGDGGIKIAVDKQLNIYVGGSSAASGPNFLDLLAIKYSQTVGINTISINIPTKLKLEQNYPNPFNPVTNIRFKIKDYGRITLNVYNLLGEKLETLIDQNLSPGEYEFKWSAETYVSGIYFYTLETGNFKETKKMILIK